MPAPKPTVALPPYSVAKQLWPVERGHHRALVQVAAKADAVRAHIPWRRRDSDPGAKDVVVIESATGKRVANVARVDIRREYGDIVFQAKQAGQYEVYYLPYAPEPTQYYYGKGYTPPSDTADAAWLASHGLTPEAIATGGWRSLPEAAVTGFEARTEFDSFYPMEVVASADEVAGLVAAHPQPYLLFPEDRKLPIRMAADVPVRWVQNGPSAEFSGQALRNEYYAFQIGVFASRGPLADVKTVFSDLRAATGTAKIPASALRCFNLGGVDTNGHAFTKRVDVPQGKVQALWFGVDVPEKIALGEYAGSVTISAEGAPATKVAVRLTVGAGALADRGDSETWRHSRLRWLDSSAGIDDEVVAPYTPLKVSGRTVWCLGRAVRFGADGLPASIKAGTTEVLAAPVRFVVETGAGALAFRPGRAAIVKQAPGVVSWAASSQAPGASLECRAEMEFDGHVLYRLTLKAAEALHFTDLRLELPIEPKVAKYFMGAGRKGCALPLGYDWRWTGPYDSFWIGDVPAGIHCELRGGAYNGPLLNLFHPAPPATWGNGGKGGVRLEESGGAVVAKAYSSVRDLDAGESITFEFALIVTPQKPLDTARAFHYRYYHGGDKPIVDQNSIDSGVNVINVHHANSVNPYINYPFLATEKLTALVREWQARSMKVKLYYTVRELTNYVTELWALRSLGREVLDGGPGGGFTWLREHLVDNYTSQWYVPYPDGTADAALLTSGESRWYNYYIEGLAWLVRNIGIDGLYLDDVSYDRRILKRMRKVMEKARPGCMMDLHSNTGFSIGPANQYAEFFPYVDKVWFGESFRYNEESPDYWLTEVSGIPFGVMGEMLQSPTNVYRGMVYGITNRLVWDAAEGGGEPRPLYRLWDSFGIEQATMRGYWDERCPVRVDRDDVKATAYVRKGKALIALASWAPSAVDVHLTIDYKALGIDPAKAVLRAPAVRDFHEAAEFAPSGPVRVEPLKGWLLIVEERKESGRKRE